MANPSNWLDTGYETILLDGAPFDSPPSQRKTLNLLEGAGMTITIVDNPDLQSTDVTFAASGGGGGVVFEVAGTPASPARSKVNFQTTGSATLGLSDDPTNHATIITVGGPEVYVDGAIRKTFSDSGATLNSLSGLQQITAYLLDTSGGQPTFNLPATGSSELDDGWILLLKDPNGQWNVNPPLLATTDGSTIEIPTAPGTYSTGITCPQMTGGYLILMWDLNATQWQILGNPITVPMPLPTTERPTSPGQGLEIFDTTLGFAVWWSGTTWVNAAGVPS